VKGKALPTPPGEQVGQEKMRQLPGHSLLARERGKRRGGERGTRRSADKA